MSTAQLTVITINTSVNASLQKVWDSWNQPEHITKWNQASDDWHTPRAENDLKSGGGFCYRMEAKDGSFGFDLRGKYIVVLPLEYIEYVLEDNRRVRISFSHNGDHTDIIESFEAESVNPAELQRAGWQSILNSFKKYTEAL